jgi:hypothetical protein
MADNPERGFERQDEKIQEDPYKDRRSENRKVTTRIFTPEEAKEAFRESREIFEKEQKRRKKGGR